MPVGLKRYQNIGDLHFITFSCYQRRPYLGTPKSRNIFLDILDKVSERYQCTLDGFVVMPEHVHLLVSEPKNGALSSMMRSLKQSVAQGHKVRPFWYPRYYDFNVFTEARRIEKLSYMHANPVKRGLCTTPESWPWSSASSRKSAKRGEPVTPGAPLPTRPGTGAAQWVFAQKRQTEPCG